MVVGVERVGFLGWLELLSLKYICSHPSEILPSFLEQIISRHGRASTIGLHIPHLRFPLISSYSTRDPGRDWRTPFMLRGDGNPPGPASCIHVHVPQVLPLSSQLASPGMVAGKIQNYIRRETSACDNSCVGKGTFQVLALGWTFSQCWTSS
jgi:hypothetical protein